MKDPRSRIELKKKPERKPRESQGQRVYSEVNRLIGAGASGDTIETIPKQCSIVLMESHIFYYNTRGKKTSFNSQVMRKCMRRFPLVPYVSRGDLNIEDTGFLVLTTYSMVTCLIQSSYQGKPREVERKVAEERNN